MRSPNYKKSREIRNKYKESPLVSNDAKSSDIDDLLSCEINEQNIKELNSSYCETIPKDIQPKEIQELINDLKYKFKENRYNLLLDTTKKETLKAIVGPLGIGSFISNFDKNGGSVTTIHNAKLGIYAQDSDKYDRREYTDSNNSTGKRFSGNGKIP